MANEAHAITINGIPISLGVTEVATQDKNGLMSANDKKKLDTLSNDNPIDGLVINDNGELCCVINE